MYEASNVHRRIFVEVEYFMDPDLSTVTKKLMVITRIPEISVQHNRRFYDQKYKDFFSYKYVNAWFFG